MKVLPLIFFLLFGVFMVKGQSTSELADKTSTITFNGKKKFSDVLLAGQSRENTRFCNGGKCVIPAGNLSVQNSTIQVIPAARQHQRYNRAKLSKVGKCYVEMFLERDVLYRYIVETKDLKASIKLIAKVEESLGVSNQSENGKKIWTQSGEYHVKSTLEWSDDKSEAKFISEVIR